MGFNGVLKYISPLVVTISLTLEPLFGSLLGWVLGVAAAPGWRTLLGGGVLLAATVCVTVSSERRKAEEARGAREAAETELAPVVTPASD